MNKIVYINLSDKSVNEKEYDIASVKHYGRGLASYLISQMVPPETGRYDEQNVIAMVPGLLSGTLAPCSGRLNVASKKANDSGVQCINIAGPFSQKAASLNIAAVCITGKWESDSPAVIFISSSGIYIEGMEILKDKEVSETISILRGKTGSDSEIIGIGPSGEHMLPVAAMFSTYPEGIPSYTCARGGMGDIFGSKGVKAVVVNCKAHFNSEVYDPEGMRDASKKLAKIIVDHPICGGALPAYGSITLMKMMKEGKYGISLLSEEGKEKKQEIKSTSANMANVKINKCCAPLCVIGCLNRHTSSDNMVYRSPAESEVSAALKQAFSIDDRLFSSKLNEMAFELGIDSVEFVFSMRLFFNAECKEGSKEELIDALNEVKKLTTRGRVLGGRTGGIYNLYRDKKSIDKLVTRPSVLEEHNFKITIPNKAAELQDIDDAQYLYACMTVHGNLGICLFTSFALLESSEAQNILSKMFFYKTGIQADSVQLIKYGLECLELEKEYEIKAKLASTQQNIPEFVKVLYRYFGREA